MNHRLLSSNKLLGNVEPKKLLILVSHRKQVNSTTDKAKVRIILRILIFIGRLFTHGVIQRSPSNAIQEGLPGNYSQ